jgi:hypothetical protein
MASADFAQLHSRPRVGLSSGTDAVASLTRASVVAAKHGTHGVQRHTTQVNSRYRAV